MNKEVIIISDLSESSGGTFAATAHVEARFPVLAIFCLHRTLYKIHSWKLQSVKKESTNLSRKERELPLWKRLVLAELHAGVQILNKEVVVKPKFTIHNVKNEVSFSFCKYQPWYKNINTCLESQFWKLYVDSLFCSSAHFGNFAHHCVVPHLVIEIKKIKKLKKNLSAMGFFSREILIHSQRH